jgi:hypothetical protein
MTDDPNRYVTVTCTPDEAETLGWLSAVETVTVELASAGDRLPVLRAAASAGHIDQDAPERAHAATKMLARRRVVALAQYQHAARLVPGGHARITALLRTASYQPTPSPTPKDRP